MKAKDLREWQQLSVAIQALRSNLERGPKGSDGWFYLSCCGDSKWYFHATTLLLRKLLIVMEGEFAVLSEKLGIEL